MPDLPEAKVFFVLTSVRKRNKPMIRVLIADDNAQVRASLCLVLGLWDDFECVGEATNGREAVRMCARLRPNVVLMDLVMPEMDGITATRIIHQKFPYTQVIILTSILHSDLLAAAIAAGAQNALLKTMNIDELAASIRSAAFAIA
jgi:two-component system, NarL family, response regulator LiaR